MDGCGSGGKWSSTSCPLGKMLNPSSCPWWVSLWVGEWQAEQSPKGTNRKCIRLPFTLRLSRSNGVWTQNLYVVRIWDMLTIAGLDDITIFQILKVTVQHFEVPTVRKRTRFSLCLETSALWPEAPSHYITSSRDLNQSTDRRFKT